MQRTKQEIKLPMNAFAKCPACGCKDTLHQISIDVYCHSCGWDSISAFVDAGGMDQMIYAYEIEQERRSLAAAVAQIKNYTPKEQIQRRAV